MSKRSLLPLLLVLGLFAGACGGTEETATADTEAETTTEAPATTAAPDTTEVDATESDATESDATESEAGTAAAEIDGRAVYESNCARCHGADGAGGQGPKLIGIAEKTGGDTTNAISLVTNGGRNMPSFGTKLSPEEIVAAVDYSFATWPDTASS